MDGEARNNLEPNKRSSPSLGVMDVRASTRTWLARVLLNHSRIITRREVLDAHAYFQCFRSSMMAPIDLFVSDGEHAADAL